MLDYMKLTQIIALFLGIGFTVISIVTTIIAFKYAKKIGSMAKALALCLITPFLACCAWLYLVLSYVGSLRKSEILALVVAILLSLFIMGMVVIVSKALYNRHGATLEEYDAMRDEIEKTDEELEETEKAIEEQELALAKIENENKVYVAPLLLQNSQEENENTIIVDAEEETEVEPQSEEESEPAQEQEEETTEETVTEEQEETVEENNNEENKQEETEEETDADDDFDKFLEELRKKVEDDNNGEGNND